MNRLSAAFRAFFAALKVPTEITSATGPASGPAGARDQAVTLIALLQREGRLLDFLMEPIDSFSDAQVGAAARSVHRSCRTVMDRVFAPKPAVKQKEGSALPIPAGYDASRFRLTGNVTGKPPFKGTLRHPGWEATRVELPVWTGKSESARVITPAEVEIT